MPKFYVWHTFLHLFVHKKNRKISKVKDRLRDFHKDNSKLIFLVYQKSTDLITYTLFYPQYKADNSGMFISFPHNPQKMH